LSLGNDEEVLACAQNLKVVAEREKTEDGWMDRLTCPTQEVVLFCRQLQVMLSSGVPVYQALETLSTRDEHPQFGRAVDMVARKVGGGNRLSQSLRLFPRIFDTVFIALIAVGEETGQLDKCLDRLARWKERDLEMRRKMRSAMTYPVLVLVLTVVMTLFLFIWILPGFIDIFTAMGADLPLPTRFLIAATHMTVSPAFWLVIIVLGVAAMHGLRRYLSSPQGRAEMTLLIMTIPSIGPLLHNAGAARMAASVGTMLDSGMDLTRSLALGAEASGNAAIMLDSKRLLQEIRLGSLTSVAMSEREDLYPSNLLQMVKVGEQASDLPEMFKRAAEFHEEETNHLIDTLGAALEPVLLAGVAIILGFVLISVFLPLYGHLDKL
jgi:type IV pilus assembly protein PilC